jgi:carboxypeptidase Taq
MSNTHHPVFQQIHKQSKTTSILESIHNLLEWDQETYMPKEAIEYRSLQIELMASLVHKQKTSKTFKTLLSKLIDIDTGNYLDNTLSIEEKSALREWRRDYLKASKLPASFVKQFAKVTSKAIHAWTEAKHHNRFGEFSNHLEKIVELCRKKADFLGYKEHPYDALLDLYEPDMTCKRLDELFAKLKHSLKELLKTIHAKPKPPRDFLSKDYSQSSQMKIGQQILKSLGFSSGMNRLDLSSHPFCNSLNPKDVRMTTRIIQNMPLSNIFSVIHEAGHGIYEAQLNEKMFGSPLCSAISLGIHESQSRFWETIIGKSFPFWQHFFPIIQNEFPSQLANVSLDEFFAAVNFVEPSLIRVEADEVTYCLHVILRYEIEKELIEGTLSVKDLPHAWNKKMREYLGVVPHGDNDGCLQDIHWSMGGFGYFPTYALGNLYAAQIFETFSLEHPEWKNEVSKGHFTFIREWLKKKLHHDGRKYSADEVIQNISGKRLEAAPYTEYLKNKFQKVYRF